MNTTQSTHTLPCIAFTKVRLPFGWLGNMAPYPVVFQDLRWPTTEHLFQALRFPADGNERSYIRGCLSPMHAKMFAKSKASNRIVLPRGDADVHNMKMVLKLKLEQHPGLQSWLKDTKNSLIVEDCSARPNESGLFWGAQQKDGGWVGENTLGKLWMRLRDELR